MPPAPQARAGVGHQDAAGGPGMTPSKGGRGTKASETVPSSAHRGFPTTTIPLGRDASPPRRGDPRPKAHLRPARLPITGAEYALGGARRQALPSRRLRRHLSRRTKTAATRSLSRRRGIQPPQERPEVRRHPTPWRHPGNPQLTGTPRRLGASIAGGSACRYPGTRPSGSYALADGRRRGATGGAPSCAGVTAEG